MGTQNWSISWLYLASCSVEENSGCRDFFSDWVKLGTCSALEKYKCNFWRNYRIFHTTGEHKGITVKQPFNLFCNSTVCDFFNWISQFHFERSQLAWVCSHIFTQGVYMYMERESMYSEVHVKLMFEVTAFWASFYPGKYWKAFFAPRSCIGHFPNNSSVVSSR